MEIHFLQALLFKLCKSGSGGYFEISLGSISLPLAPKTGHSRFPLVVQSSFKQMANRAVEGTFEAKRCLN